MPHSRDCNAVFGCGVKWRCVQRKSLAGSSALDFALRLRYMVSTSSRRKDVGGLWQWQHPPHCKRYAQTLRAICGTAAPPLPNKFIGTARAKKAPLVWSCCEKYRRWTDQGTTLGCSASLRYPIKKFRDVSGRPQSSCTRAVCCKIMDVKKGIFSGPRCFKERRWRYQLTLPEYHYAKF